MLGVCRIWALLEQIYAFFERSLVYTDKFSYFWIFSSSGYA